MQTRSDPANRPLPLRTLALAAVTVSLLAVFGAWIWGRMHPGIPAGGDVVAEDRSEAIVRRTEVALADAEAVWRHETGGRYDPLELVFFSGATGTACAGGDEVSGPFYCPETGTAAFDLTFLNALAGRLQRQEELGLALVAARMSAVHLQREIGRLDAAALQLIGARRARRGAIAAALALEADCLTGVWASAAEPRLGPVPAGFYGQLVWSWRNVVDDLAQEGVRVPPEFDAFAAAAQDDRAEAFARGYAAGGIAGCPAPVEIAADR